MNSIKCIIVDDDPFTREQLQDKIHRLIPDLQIMTTCEHAIEGLEAIKKYNPALVFLDIRMPGISGFQLLDSLDHPNFEVVFITSYNQYAITAIRYSALDYLLKPIQDEELKHAVDRFREKNNILTLQSRLKNLLHNISPHNNGDLNLLIPTRQGEKHIPVNNIIRCEADSNYTHFYLKDRSKFTSSKTLKEYEITLVENDFIRIHKSHIINRNHVEKVRDESCVIMNDKSEVEISRRRWPEVKHLFAAR